MSRPNAKSAIYPVSEAPAPTLSPLPFHYQNGQLHCESVPIAEIAAAVGTPLYLYSQADMVARAAHLIQHAPPQHLICYAVKANGNPTLLRLLREAGLGADVTSGGELYLARHAGIRPEQIIFSGVGKLGAEIEAALRCGIRAIHIESAAELTAVAHIAAQLNLVAPIGLRVNPDIAADTHPSISTGQAGHKFGVSLTEAPALLAQAATHPHLRPVGIAAHIGSQIRDVGPLTAVAHSLLAQANEAAQHGIRLDYIDVGGGWGLDYIDYTKNHVAELAGWVTAVGAPIAAAGYELVLEPGRSIVGPAGALITDVVYTKKQGRKQFVVVDAAMNDLIRPALYEAHHPIWPVEQPRADARHKLVDVVGPICETTDFLARDRSLPTVVRGDRLAILLAGAYGFAMSSNYNGRPRAAEVLVDGATYRVIRPRQSLSALLS